MDAETWHISLVQDSITIREALSTMESFKLNQGDIPFVIRLFENPKYRLLPGSVTLASHDIIHVLLGRGLLPKDEAFVIGFTMGTTRRLTSIQKSIFKFVTRFLYPAGYTFGPAEHKIFEIGLRSASDMTCPDFSELDLCSYIDYTIKEGRRRLGIDVPRLMVDYGIEKSRYKSLESQRLL
jgi:hypothetical protein